MSRKLVLTKLALTVASIITVVIVAKMILPGSDRSVAKYIEAKNSSELTVGTNEANSFANAAGMPIKSAATKSKESSESDAQAPLHEVEDFDVTGELVDSGRSFKNVTEFKGSVKIQPSYAAGSFGPISADNFDQTAKSQTDI